MTEPLPLAACTAAMKHIRNQLTGKLGVFQEKMETSQEKKRCLEGKLPFDALVGVCIC